MKIIANTKFQETRIRKGFTITRLAEKAGVTKTAVSQIERRTNGTRPATAQKIIEALDVEFDDVFTLEK